MPGSGFLRPIIGRRIEGKLAAFLALPALAERITAISHHHPPVRRSAVKAAVDILVSEYRFPLFPIML